MTAPLLAAHPVVPVVVIDDADQAVPLGQALLAGGIAVMEVTLRTAAGLEGIRRLRALEGMTVGAGSVLTVEQVNEVVDAGATFVVSPGISPDVVRRAQALGVPALPGISSSTDLMTAVSLGLKEVKFFPAGLLGGPAMIKALSAPFGGITFMPSGGVGLANLREYLALPCVPAVSGSWMVEKSLVNGERWDEVSALAAEAVAAARAALV
ncbi:bifunctional 4-hydroxy-2-oxoglutarate aldolase/2-dehydro-3-deoxy-phosphogluconate aldolase [Kineosporia mesophila]|uniref:2-dehydro-3-deoxy-phosphogluconate aldolase n=1 Tax=Kineosporia mesophila TaxID=566012 RepID=A0ABP7AVZ0_9ACTN|nr:bifunctional 4-hydroxy-2-oxoglutarate aldolase/2-dehydro-3-deoxy-phosphogluconate aldolase [Kineosporia mesophila]MCD5354150.1 bifunctional 4-hydroxy-2-oxoglutarate aldolase/2-dehydro-3-deoxy-phosphogluconate aldolase [Kineosporia mesophila]